MIAHKKLWECGSCDWDNEYLNRWESYKVTANNEYHIMSDGLSPYWDRESESEIIARMYACFFALFFADEMERVGKQQGIIVGHNFDAWIEV